MRHIPLHLFFKADLNYIQGADMYTAILKQITTEHPGSILGSITLSMHAMAHKDCDLLLAEPGELTAKPDHAVASFRIDVDKCKVAGWLIETNRPIPRRDYDEAPIEALCQIRDQCIVITGETGYLAIEVAVSMTSQLHNALFPSNDAKWIFPKLELIRPFQNSDGSSLIIQHKHNFKNRLTKSEIFSHERSIGYIYFSLVKL